MDEEIKEKKDIIPLLNLRGLVMFPGMILHFDVRRKKSVLAIKKAMESDQRIFLVTQRDIKVDNPKQEDLYTVGTVASVKQIVNQNNDIFRVLVEGTSRAVLKNINTFEPYITAEVEIFEESETEKDSLENALVRKAKELFGEYLTYSPKIAPDLILGVKACTRAGELADYITSNILLDFTEKQDILDEIDGEKRLEKLLVILTSELDILSLENKIAYKLKESLDKSQKEFYLREQVKMIYDELGEEDDPREEANSYKEKLSKLKLNDEVREKIFKECDRFSRTPPHSQEADVQRNYIETCLELPWNTSTKNKISLLKADKILNQEHYGLKKVKERIIELLAVMKLTKNVKGQIICFAGPPGVGKTSITKSIAKAMGREYVRISLGGVRDESEIRGHRRTYVGAMPGRIISAIKQAGTKNPVILLDEIDKLSKDYHGDPASALLEALDPEQNCTFHDHYIDLPFDLSEVLFITTANDKDSIPRPLLDRMEVINLYSYTREEKYHIARNHLVPKQMKRNGMKEKTFYIGDDAIRGLIDGYTKEAGVRELERKLAELMRKSAKMLECRKVKAVSIDEDDLVKMLGPVKYKDDVIENKSEIGVVRGLAWTAVGGETMPIEVSLMKGKGKIHLTGSLGDVMKESAQIAVSYIRSNADKFKVNPDFYDKTDIHIHAPEGAVPKDGPSAGVTMTTALISALSNTPVKQNVAMTGEVTLRGKVLPIGGLKEKTMAAYKAGIDTVIIPAENESDLQEVDDAVKNKINFVMADNLETVFMNSLDNYNNIKKGNSINILQ